ncbi:unnamed protein product, partial [Didymodactylos carnosus]
THFTAQEFKQNLMDIGVVHLLSTPYHPQTNGQCERFNASMCSSVATLANNNRTGWDEQLLKTTMAYNSCRHSTTKVTPFELMHGREFRSPFDLPPPTTTLPEPSEFIRHQREYRRIAYQYVQQNIVQQQNQARQRYNANRR